MQGEAVQEIRDLAQQAAGKTVVVGGKAYSTVELYDPRRKDPEPETLVVHTLSGLADYIESNRDELDLEQCVLHVVDPTTVELRSRLQGTFQQRLTYVQAKANPLVGAAGQAFGFGNWMSHESLVIALQALFAEEGQREEVLSVVGNITDENVREQADDGVTQKVTAKAGVTLATEVDLPNPVQLAPYRTFPDVEQPVSPFILRARKREGVGVQLALFEADGGAWRVEAIQRVADWLGEDLSAPRIIA